jgi:uncharacterized protein
MLTSTFIHAQGIGPTTEKRIWQAGVTDWAEFIARHAEMGLSARQLAMLLPVVEESVARLDAEDYNYFARRLPNREHWRAFGELGERAAYVDIETTGMGIGSGITVIGVYDGITTKSYIKGFNLEEFVEDIERFPLLVTFCGATFDLPHLRHAFPGTKLDQLHIDLCPALRRIGYKGGLKSIEQQLGMVRADGIKGLDGWDAVRLWDEWEFGNKESLDTLVDYNRADVENLKWLAEFTYGELKKACQCR